MIWMSVAPVATVNVDIMRTFIAQRHASGGKPGSGGAVGFRVKKRITALWDDAVAFIDLQGGKANANRDGVCGT
jgi:hypothetical protein